MSVGTSADDRAQPSHSTKRKYRCAIYTRKSSEEGLEQDFNSLDAQREACAAYVASQTSEGWSLLPELYDDGGLSGGTLKRPALQRLLSDVKEGRIDIIVVYKVDRLTRSLLDFSRLVEAFDEAEVSFVSVTQSFNTTNSMGRLTLNMLLSFAQFEREVTAERIRDKIAASKAKGMWMGGTPPLGYEPDGRSLTIVEDHAELIRDIYARYLTLGNVRHITDDLEREGVSVPLRTLSTGKTIGSGTFSRGQIYKILGNPIYRGKIAHKDTIYEGLHSAIINKDIWEAVQHRLADHSHRRLTRNERSKSLLAGLLFDEKGSPLNPVHTSKPVPGKPPSAARRYRYYIETSEPRTKGSNRPPPLRIAASEIEPLVKRELKKLFDGPLSLIERAGITAPASLLPALESRSKKLAGQITRNVVRDAIKRVTIHPERIVITIRSDRIASLLGVPIEMAQCEATFGHIVSASLKRSGLAVRLIQSNGTHANSDKLDMALTRLIHQARQWWQELAKGKLKVAALAKDQGVSPSYVSRVIRLAFLSPQVVDAILAGEAPASLDANALQLAGAIAYDWEVQKIELLGVRQAA